MTEQKIPAEAVEAAADALVEIRRTGQPYTDMEVAERVLEAAARQVTAMGWDEGAKEAWARSTPEVNGQSYQWRTSGEPLNPYR